MKKFLVMFLMVVFAFGTMLITGCGGGSEGQKVKSAADEEGQVMDEAKQKAKEELPNTYLVEKGDTLYSIAEKPEIYGNKYQWPVIFDANKDIIDDYKTVNEGQRLIIPRNITAVDIEKAKQKATELNWPPAENATAQAPSGKEAGESVQEGAVAGISQGKHLKVRASAAPVKEASVAEGASSQTEEQPTPIPEPSKKAKKSGPNMIALMLILLGVIAVVIYFIIAQRNKKKEEDEEEKEEKSDNILG
jgi:LysM repeat protein